MYISRTKGEIFETKGKDFYELTIRGSVPSARSCKLSSASNIEPTMDIYQEYSVQRVVVSRASGAMTPDV